MLKFGIFRQCSRIKGFCVGVLVISLALWLITISGCFVNFVIPSPNPALTSPSFKCPTFFTLPGISVVPDRSFPTVFCGCPGVKLPDSSRFTSTVASHCSNEATLFGKHQKVVSFAAFVAEDKHFSDIADTYFSGIRPNLEDMFNVYPGWIMRVYTNLPSEHWNSTLCPIVCEYPESFFVCDAYSIPALDLGDVTSMSETTWRFLVLGDPTVDIFIVRDFDHPLIQRDRDAVAEFEASSFIFHSMRDHEWHTWPIMAGMWGAKNSFMSPNMSATILNEFKEKKWAVKYSRKSTHTLDQVQLREIIYNKYEDLIMVHDSSMCLKFNDKHWYPFPKQRKDLTDVIANFRHTKDRTAFDALPCPFECRPSYGKNWTYC